MISSIRVIRSNRHALNLDRDPVMRLLPWLMAVAGFFFGLAAILFLANQEGIGGGSKLEAGTLALVIPWTTQKKQNAAAKQAIGLIQNTKGLASPRLLSSRERAALLKPWLGSANPKNLSSLPVLISMKIAEPDLNPANTLREKLKKSISNARLIENAKWQGDQQRVSRTLKGFLLALLLVTLATMMLLLTFATRIGLKAQDKTIETIQLLGATKKFVSGQFGALALRVGLFGGLIAAFGLLICALLVWLFVPSETLAALWIKNLFTPLLITLILTPILTALMAWTGAWFGLRQTFRHLEHES